MNDLDAALLAQVRIRQVLEHYCAALDHGNVAELAELFDANCSFAMMGRSYHGRAEILTVWEQLTSTTRPATLHVLINPVIIVAGDRATAVSGWAMIDRNGADGRTAVALAGHYHDTLERGADASWRFTSRRVQTLARAPRPR